MTIRSLLQSLVVVPLLLIASLVPLVTAESVPDNASGTLAVVFSQNPTWQ